MTLAHDSDFVKLCLEIPHDIEHVRKNIPQRVRFRRNCPEPENKDQDCFQR